MDVDFFTPPIFGSPANTGNWSSSALKLPLYYPKDGRVMQTSIVKNSNSIEVPLGLQSTIASPLLSVMIFRCQYLNGYHKQGLRAGFPCVCLPLGLS